MPFGLPFTFCFEFPIFCIYFEDSLIIDNILYLLKRFTISYHFQKYSSSVNLHCFCFLHYMLPTGNLTLMCNPFRLAPKFALTSSWSQIYHFNVRILASTYGDTFGPSKMLLPNLALDNTKWINNAYHPSQI